MSVIKQWPVFFLLSAFAIAPLFQGGQMGILVAILVLILTVFIKVFLASYQKIRIPYNYIIFNPALHTLTQRYILLQFILEIEIDGLHYFAHKLPIESVLDFITILMRI